MEWVLDRPLPAVDVVGSLGADKVLDLLHDAGAPISFIAGTGKDPAAHYVLPKGTTVQELLDEMMGRTPGYQLAFLSNKVVIYPSEGGYDEPVGLDAPSTQKRIVAYFTVQKGLDSKIPVLRGIRIPRTRREPTVGFYGDIVSVGGIRKVVEHLISLVADRPSANIVVKRGTDGSLELATWWADLIREFYIEVPEKVEIGREFQVIPRLILVDNSTVTLVGTKCGVRYEATEVDPSLETTGQSFEDQHLVKSEKEEVGKESEGDSQPTLVDEIPETFVGTGARYEAAEPDPPTEHPGPAGDKESLTIGPEGRVIAARPGTVRISARYLGMSASEEVEVIDVHAEPQPDRSN